MTGGYSIQAKNGKYIGQTSDENGLTSSNTPTLHTLALSDSNVDIICSGQSTRLRYNATSGQDRFRYYKSATYTQQQPIQLYKRISVAVIIGDVNDDEAITIADVTALVNIILGKDDDEPHLYNHAAADVNDDGTITIADVTALVNLILGKND